MKMLKPFISTLLILTYSLGFAHNLIPHCHELMNETHSNDHHSANHSSHEVSEEGFLDLIVCLFSELEHSSDILNFESSNNSSPQTAFKDMAKIKALALVAVFLHLTEAEQPTQPETAEQIIVYAPPFIESAPSRGSPLLSC